MLDSEKVLSDKGEHHTEISGDPGRPRRGPEEDPVPPGDGRARCCLCPGWADGKELLSDPGDRAGPGQTHHVNGRDLHRARYYGDSTY